MPIINNKIRYIHIEEEEKGSKGKWNYLIAQSIKNKLGIPA